MRQWALVSDAAQATGVPAPTVRTWVARGRIDSQRIGGKVHVDLAQVRRAERDMRVHGARPGRARVAS